MTYLTHLSYLLVVNLPPTDMFALMFVISFAIITVSLAVWISVGIIALYKMRQKLKTLSKVIKTAEKHLKEQEQFLKSFHQ
jgi:cell division protein FtsL